MFGTPGEGFVRFPLFGIPVSIDWTFLLVPLLASSGGWQRALIWTVVVFVSVLLHELGHAVAMRVFGFAPRVSIYALGGLTYWPQGAAPTPKQNFVVSGSGPAVSITLGVASLLAAFFVDERTMGAEVINVSIWINLVWGAINLLPLMPLDGGHMLDTAATIITGKTQRWVGLVSVIAGGLVIAAAAKFGLIFLGFIGVFAILRGWSRWTDQTPDFDTVLKQATELTWGGKRAEAETLLQTLEVAAARPEQRAAVVQQLAYVRLLGGDVAGAEQAVRRLPEGWQVAPELKARLLATRDDVDGVIATLLPEVTSGRLEVTAAPLLASALMSQSRFTEVEAVATLMLANAKTRADPFGHVSTDLTARLFQAGEVEACMRLSQFLWQKFRAGEDAFNQACCFVKKGQLDEAMRWLDEAVRAGMPELKKALEEDADLAPLRSRPDFETLITRVSAQ
jgi:Zn-dependent protease